MPVLTHNGRHKPTFYKDPDAQLDYWFTWGDWLTATETITDVEFVVSPTSFFTVEDDTLSDDSEVIDGVTYTDLKGALISGGTAGETGELTCRITTSDGGIVRIEDRTIKIKVKDH